MFNYKDIFGIKPLPDDYGYEYGNIEITIKVKRVKKSFSQICMFYKNKAHMASAERRQLEHSLRCSFDSMLYEFMDEYVEKHGNVKDGDK